MKMKKILLGAALCGACALVLSGCEEEPVRLAVNGKTDYVIVTDADATENVRFAAWDLARILKRITGAEFPLAKTGDALPDGGKRIEVGTKLGAKCAGAERMAKLGHNGALAMSAGGNVLLVGKDDYGITGAVYDFLEKQLGCRWYTAFGDEKIPERTAAVLKPFETLVNPPLESRWLLTVGSMTCARKDGDLFLFRNGVNMTGGHAFQNVSLPTNVPHLKCEYVSLGGYCHTLFTFIKPHGKEDYFGKHPEWFTLVKGKNGKPDKRVDNRQLCFANRELRNEYTKKFLKYVEDKHGRGVFNISAMDIPGPFCECEKCLALTKEYGTVGAPLFDYLIEVGKILESRYPQALLSTLVYRKGQTQRPPNANCPKFPSNILATFAPIDDDFSKDMVHSNNCDTVKDLAKWRTLVDHIWAWYYPIPYTSINPYAGIRRSAVDTREMLRAGLTGASYEHDVGRDNGVNFYDMHTWVLTKLFREPDLDVEALVKEFCADYYGAAADEVWRYWDSLERMRESYPKYVEWNGTFPLAYTPAQLVEWKGLMDAAEAKVAGDPKILQHVREARLGLDNIMLTRYPNLKRATPGPGITAEALRDRLTNTYCRCAQRRNRGDGKAEREKVLTLYMLAGADDLKPAEFKDVPDSDILQSFAIRGGSGCKRRPEKDSCIGQACWDDKEGKSGRKDLGGWIYDEFGKRTLATYSIKNKDMVEGKFHFYKVGRIRLTPACYLVFGSNWYVLSQLSDLYTPGVDEQWDVYVSAKFEGPQYFPGSALKESRAVFDRTVLVRAK